MHYVFDSYTLDPEHYELHRGNTLVRLEPRVFNLLAYLVQHPGHTVTKEDLWAQVWPQLPIFSDQSLKKCVQQARKALGDAGQTPRYIQTVRSRGYRFIAPVEVRPQAESNAQPLTVPDTQIQADEPSRDQGDAVSPPGPVPSVPLPISSPAQDKASALHPPEHDWPDAEWRQLTVLTCRLVNVAAPTVALDPEVRLEVIRDYQAICTEVLHQFDGPMPQYRGTELEAHFGYPQAYEDAARRAVLAGLGIVEGMVELTQRLKRDWDVQLAVRVGIHTGLEVVAVPQHGNHHDPLALGDTRTIATQLQDLAKPGTMLISQTTLRLVDGYFVCEALGTHMLEETAEPLAVYQVLRKSTDQHRLDVAITKGLTPFVGREQEVGLLRERWEQATDGQGQVVVLSGEAGIGKSRLVQVLKGHLNGQAHTWIEYRCSPYYQQSAFYPIIEHVQRLLQFHADDTPEERLHKLEEVLRPYSFALDKVIPLFATLLSIPLSAPYAPLSLTPEQQKQKILEALLVWLLQEAERQPVCMIVEDLHWVDPSTLEWLTLLIDQLPTAHVLLLLVHRPDFRPPWASRSYLTQIMLSRLSRRHVETMVQRITDSKALPTEVLHHLVATTDGVPLFVEELTKMVLESGLIKEREGQYELAGPLPALAIPTTLHDSLMTRLDRLGSAKQVAQLGAVVGREFAYEILQAVAPLEEATLQQGLAQLVTAELLYQRGFPPQARYMFKHALIQEAAYESIPKSTRRRFHQQLAEVLGVRFPETCKTHPELLAYHYTEASLSEQAIPYWRRAGQCAIERSANVEAISHLMKGLEVLKTLPATPKYIQQELMLQLALGSPLLVVKGHTDPEVERAYTRAQELCQQVGEPLQRFAALVGLWRFYLNQTRLNKALELVEECFSIAQRLQDQTLLLEIHLMLGSTLQCLGEFVSARVHLEHGIALYDPQQCHSLVFSRATDPGVYCLSWAAWTLWMLGYPTQALTMSHKALTLAQQLSHAYSLGLALHFSALLHQCCREAQLVQKRTEAAIALSTEQGFARWLGGGMIMRGWALAEQGSAEEGIVQLHQGLAIWRGMGVELGVPYFLAMLAEAYGKEGQAEEGLRILAEALDIMQRNDERRLEAELYRLKGELLLQEGIGRDHGRTSNTEALIVANTKRRKGTHSLSLQTEAEICFHQAIDVSRHQHAKSLELRAVISLSRLWQQQDKRAEARQVLMEIYSWFREGFDTPDLQEAKALLEELE
jgi:DNA-binding winged helix-turn-helix (wHTH) protein/class 3 adenylate cyclase/predicted ATPase